MIVLGLLSDERAFKSKSPLMHNAVLKQNGIDGAYVPFPVQPDRVQEAVNGIRALGIRGVNITVPHKEAVIPHLDWLSEEVSTLGAANTIVNTDGRLHGYNTDISGFADALKGTGFDCSGKKALVFGAGGAAKAVLLALRNSDIRTVHITSRDRSRSEKTAGLLNATVVPMDEARSVAESADLLVNATSVSDPKEAPEFAEMIKALAIPNCGLVFDLNYGRVENFWKDLAASHEIPFTDGLTMLAYQAAGSFFLWTGIDAGGDVFLSVLKETG